MSKVLLNSYLLIIVIFLSQCGIIPNGPSDPSSETDILQIQIGRSNQLYQQNLKIGFDTVFYDSRCVIGSENCIGKAEVGLWLIKPGFDSTYLHMFIIGSNEPFVFGQSEFETIDTLGYVITLVGLDPIPPDTQTIIYDKYTLTVQLALYEPVNDLEGKVRLNNIPPDNIWINYYELENISILGDTLTVRVGHGGGCRKHYYLMYIFPSDFFVSQPPVANLYLRHYNNADRCEAYLHPYLKFDLSPLKNHYERNYPYERVILLNVYNYPGEKPEKINIYYRF